MRPAKRSLLYLAATVLTLLWWQMIADLRNRQKSNLISTDTSLGERVVANKNDVQVRDFDLNSKILEFSIAARAAELIETRCEQAPIFSVQECIDRIRDSEYYRNTKVLPILKELSELPMQVKEISYKAIKTQAEDTRTTTKINDNFYCINPSLPRVEKMIWSTAIETAGLTEQAEELILQMRKNICKTHVIF